MSQGNDCWLDAQRRCGSACLAYSEQAEKFGTSCRALNCLQSIASAAAALKKEAGRPASGPEGNSNA